MIDLRSDTVTLPSPAMREAMAQAEVGDDVYGEDPTVNTLETLAAERVGKAAAVLVPSGTMGNLSSLLAHCTRGQRIILGSESHIYHYEVGGAAALGGLIYDLVPNLPDGTLEPEALHDAVKHKSGDVHLAPPGVVCLENTHNRCGGTVLTPDYMAQIHALAQEHGLPLHVDGARIFNAAVALNMDVDQFTRYADSVQFCLSKGLSAPVGSVVAGTQPFIGRVRMMRKMLGGGMRQAGVIAAAGIVALTEMVQRLAEDHHNAATLADALAAIPGICIDRTQVQTNIVIFTLADDHPMTTTRLLDTLKGYGVLMGELGAGRIRAVTHYGISAEDMQSVIRVLRWAMNAA